MIRRSARYETVLRIHHRLIIRHPSQPAILVGGDDGRLRLPAFESDDRHTAEVDYINLAVRERFGLVTTVLRSLHHSDPVNDVALRAHELETHGDEAPLPPPMQWCDRDDVSPHADGEDRDVVAEWLAAPITPRTVVDGRGWTLPGWFAEAREWIEGALAVIGGRRVREIVQLRAWMSSCVLLVRTGAGDLYFKAVPESGRRECVVTAYLAQHFPQTVARIVAAQPERRWLLMRAFEGRKLEDVDDIRTWERAAAEYARLQRACLGRLDDLHALRCPTRSLEALAAAIDPLVANVAGLRPGEPDGLSASEVDRLHARASELRRRCEQLAACGIPPTIEHGDLWPGNVLVDDATCGIIDWEDVAIGHPFLSLAPLIVGLSIYQPRLASPAVTRRLERAYEAGFTDLAPPERLREALRCAAPLSFVDMALRYRSQRPSVVRLHPWMRDLVPQTLRLALAQLDAEA